MVLRLMSKTRRNVFNSRYSQECQECEKLLKSPVNPLGLGMQRCAEFLLPGVKTGEKRVIIPIPGCAKPR